MTGQPTPLIEEPLGQFAFSWASITIILVLVCVALLANGLKRDDEQRVARIMFLAPLWPLLFFYAVALGIAWAWDSAAWKDRR